MEPVEIGTPQGSGISPILATSSSTMLSTYGYITGVDITQPGRSSSVDTRRPWRSAVSKKRMEATPRSTD